MWQSGTITQECVIPLLRDSAFVALKKLDNMCALPQERDSGPHPHSHKELVATNDHVGLDVDPSPVDLKWKPSPGNTVTAVLLSAQQSHC